MPRHAARYCRSTGHRYRRSARRRRGKKQYGQALSHSRRRSLRPTERSRQITAPRRHARICAMLHAPESICCSVIFFHQYQFRNIFSIMFMSFSGYVLLQIRSGLFSDGYFFPPVGVKSPECPAVRRKTPYSIATINECTMQTTSSSSARGIQSIINERPAYTASSS